MAQPHDEVILVDAQQVGFAIDLPHDIGAADYIGELPIARMNLKLNLHAQAILRQLIGQHAIDCQLRPDGKYQAAVEDKGLAVLQAYRRGLDKLDQPYRMVDTRDLPEHLGSAFYRRAQPQPAGAAAQLRGQAEPALGPAPRRFGKLSS